MEREPSTFGSLLHRYRLAADLTQAELARRAGMSVRAVRDIESGRVGRPRGPSRRRLAAACGMDPEELTYATGDPERIEIGVLGSLVVRVGPAPVAVRSRLQRDIVGLLALHLGEVVSGDHLVDVLWADDPPRTCRVLLQDHVARLRALVAPGCPRRGAGQVIETTRGGYRLLLEPGRLDLGRFDDLARQAGQAADLGDSDTAHTRYGQALDLWRGTVLADSGPRLRQHPAVAAAEARRITVTLAAADVAIAQGRHADAADRLRGPAADEPLHEGVHARLVVALAGCGRPAEAIELYGQVRRRLADELGVDPGPELQASYRAILHGPGAVPSGRTAGDGAPGWTLPADTATFTGRGGEVHRLVAAGTTDRRATVQVIDGMPGVGKTALAVHVGHRLAARYPDGQLLVDLHGYTAGRSPADPHDVLGGLLAAGGADGRYLPETVDARAALWRERMAGQRALLILDNAASSTQVAPLLPGTAGCRVIVTSRRHLSDLPGAVDFVSLDVLAPDEAAAMFLTLLPRGRADREGAGAVAAICGYLPLAIALVARVFIRHRSWSIDNLIAETAARRLTVAAENRTVAAAFDLSYQDVGADEQRVVRLLGAHPGVDIDPYAAAALTGLPLEEAVRHLDTLHGHHLVEERAYRRYRLHDLIREYVRAVAAGHPAAERDEAVERLLDYYQHTAAIAGAGLAHRTRPAPTTAVPVPGWVPEIGDPTEAHAWLTAERANLLAGLDFAADRPARVVGLTAALAPYLRTEDPLGHTADRHAEAVAAADRTGDRLGYANALTDLGDVRSLAGDYPGADKALQEALRVYEHTADRPGQAHVLYHLGVLRWLTCDYHEAATLLWEALEVYRAIGDRLGEANVRYILGSVAHRIESFPAARALLEQALAIYREIEQPRGQAYALVELGFVASSMGDHAGNAELTSQSLDICRRIGDRRGEANALNALADLTVVLGDYAGAVPLVQQALDIYRETANRPGEIDAILVMGSVQMALADYPAATVYLHEALRQHRKTGNPDGEAAALNALGKLYLAQGDAEQALRQHRASLRIARVASCLSEVARSLELAGRAAQALGRTATAARYLREAREAYERIGSPNFGLVIGPG